MRFFKPFGGLPVFLFILCFLTFARAQDGFIDPDIDFTVARVIVQPDGRILAAGSFNNVAGQPRSKVARLNANGSLDTSFQNPNITGQFSNDNVFAMKLQPDGKILIGGQFTGVGGQTRNYLARLNPDGSLDAAFAPVVNNPVVAIGLQTDGKILIGGYFTTAGGQARTYVARLNADGSLDGAFQNPVITVPGPVLPVSTLAVQSDNKVLVGGQFNSIGGQSRSFAARLNADGSLDTSFALAPGGPVGEFLPTPAGDKIFISGFFSAVNGTPRTTLALVNTADGALDTSFQNVNIPSGYVGPMALQPNGKLIVGGEFSTIAGTARDDLARLNADGSFDATFTDPNANFGGQFFSLNSLALQPDGKLLVGGQFTTIGRQTRKNLVRLNADGSLDRPPAQTLVVTKTADTNDGACSADCSLREAFAAANASPDPSAIIFDPQLFATPQTLLLTAGELVVADNHRISVTGTGRSLVTISGGGASRIVRVNRDASLALRSLTLANGNGVGGGDVLNTGGAVYLQPNGVVTELSLDDVLVRNSSASSGGAIGTVGSSVVTVRNSTLNLNSANGSGGAILFDTGTLTITDSFITGNSAATQGGGTGGIATGVGGPTVSISGSSIAGNTGGVGGLSLSGTTTLAGVQIVNNQGNALTGGLSVSGTATLTDSIVTGNSAPAANSLGGGIGNFGRLTLTGTTVGGNSAAFGGGIYTAGGLTIAGSVIEGNSSGGDGGGIYNNAGGTTGQPVAVRSSIVRNNASGAFGGGFYNRDTLTLDDSTVTGNTAVTNGGGAFNVFLNNVGSALFNVNRATFYGNSANAAGGALANQAGTVKFTNSTLSGNTARGVGGAVSSNSGGTVALSSTTVAFNTSTLGTGGGINNSGSSISADNTIFASNTAATPQRASDFNGTLASGGFNLLSSTAGTVITGTTTGNRLDTSARLGPLADNGGPVLTHALRTNSPAIDGGNAGAGIITDARGKTRPFDFQSIPNAPGGSGADIGAFERQATDVDLSTTPFDFDGDGRTDISIFRPSNGEWWLNRSSSGATVAAQFGTGTDCPVPGDFTGDGRTDVAFFRPTTGEWFVLRSEDGSYFSFPFGASGDVPVPGDYDGDGKTDAAVFRPATATWFVLKSSGGTTIAQFGAAGDVPVPSDYDGDGKADIAIYRPSNGQWWLARSIGGVLNVTFGTADDRPVAGDYTGDGRSDIAFFRPSTGEWFVLRSEDFSFFSFPFGAPGDLPVAGDYDGDGRFDPGVFRPSGSTWYVNRSSAGLLIVTFGASGDRPLPNAFVPQ
ncbi:MAG: VCBS repeat-containing protein [Acidobacteria bacterium]|nr:VCBS repeat-containing protein [Acidobacteriota bacterium]